MQEQQEDLKNSDFSDNPYFLREARDKYWRLVVFVVERIIYGKPAKKKRTGSRGVPQRLNQEERFLYDQGRKKGFLEVAGSAWRSQQREAPYCCHRQPVSTTTCRETDLIISMLSLHCNSILDFLCCTHHHYTN